MYGKMHEHAQTPHMVSQIQNFFLHISKFSSDKSVVQIITIKKIQCYCKCS